MKFQNNLTRQCCIILSAIVFTFSSLKAQNSFTMQRWTGAWGSDGPIFTGDLNGDRRTDVFMWRKSDNSWTVNLSSGSGFAMQRWTGAWGSDGPINTGDLNGDGKTDVFMWRGSDNSWTVNLSTGSGFVMQRWTGAWGSDGPINTGDLNGDGKTDVFMWRRSDNSWTINLSTGAGFVMQRWTGAWGSDGPINTGDLNGDGKTDVFMWRNTDKSWTVNLSTGTGFAMQRWTGAWGSDGPIHVGDLNGDRKTDVFMWRQSDNSWTVNLSNGNGFTMRQWFGACRNNNLTLTGDFNGDKKMDVTFWNNNISKWMTSLSNGTGFYTDMLSGAWGSDGPARTGDLNGDGRTDIFMWRDVDKSWTVNLSKPIIPGASNISPTCNAPQWKSLGPYTLRGVLNYLPCGGRIDAMAISPNYNGMGQPALFIGSEGTGIFRWGKDFPQSTSPQWESLSNNLPAIADPNLRKNINYITSIAVAPNNPRLVIASPRTNPPFLLKSIDGGNSWNLSGLNQFQNIASQINAVAIDNRNEIFVAAQQRMFVGDLADQYTDITPANLVGCTFKDVVFYSDEENNNQVFVAVKDFNVTDNKTGIWELNRNETTNQFEWKKLVMDLRNLKNATFASTGIASIKLSATPNVGVVASMTAGGNPGLLNVFSISRQNDSYKATPKWFTTEEFFTQGEYVMGVCIGEDGKTYGGGIGLAQADETGQVINLQSQYNNIHVDEHVLLAYQGKIYAGTDGGLYRFTPQPNKLGAEKPESWEHLNSYTLNNFLSTSVAYNPLDPFDILVGHQDNGIAHFVNGEWVFSSGNEREQIIFDPHPDLQGKVAYAYDETNLDYLKSTDGGKSFSKLLNMRFPGLNNFCIAFHPSEKNRFITCYQTGDFSTSSTYTVKETKDGLGDLSAAKDLNPPINGMGCPTALCYAGNNIYAGVAGNILRYDGSSWTTVFTGTSQIRSILQDPSNPNTIYFATTNAVFSKPDQNSSQAWNLAPNGDLIDLTSTGINGDINELVMLSNGGTKPPTLYISTVWQVMKLSATTNGRPVRWVGLGKGLPDTPIWDIIANSRNRFLYVATYGRGVWYTQDLSDQ